MQSYLLLSSWSGTEEEWLAEEAGGLHSDPEGGKGGAEAPGGGGKPQGPPAPTAHGHQRLHPVPALQQEVRNRFFLYSTQII